MIIIGNFIGQLARLCSGLSVSLTSLTGRAALARTALPIAVTSQHSGTSPHAHAQPSPGTSHLGAKTIINKTSFALYVRKQRCNVPVRQEKNKSVPHSKQQLSKCFTHSFRCVRAALCKRHWQLPSHKAALDTSLVASPFSCSDMPDKFERACPWPRKRASMQPSTLRASCTCTCCLTRVGR